MNNIKNRNKSLDRILGVSNAISQVKSLILQVAKSDITVLITGESGTGKELVANAIHEFSSRSANPILTLNCGAIPEGIFESEIFGHEKGSFTSASDRRKGYFELADKGTLFLDEIGEMPLQVQVKILRALETGRFLRVGGMQEVSVNVRIIAATNRDLDREVMTGKFRRDLYYRLKAVSIHAPPLRERTEDIPVLAESFLKEFADSNSRPMQRLEGNALSLMTRYYWPGNVRELKNFIESLVALNPEPIITEEFVRSRLERGVSSPNLPVIISKNEEGLDNDLIFRTLLDLRNELSLIKGLLKQVLTKGSYQVEYPFRTSKEIVTYQQDDFERKNTFEDYVEHSDADEQNNQKQLSLGEVEKEQIRRTLSQFEGNRRKTAKALGIGERTLYRKLKQYNLK